MKMCKNKRQGFHFNLSFMKGVQNLLDFNEAMRQLEKYSKESDNNIDKYYPDSESKATKISSLTKNDITRFLYPLTQLRQACIHPVVVRNSFVNFEKNLDLEDFQNLMMMMHLNLIEA